MSVDDRPQTAAAAHRPDADVPDTNDPVAHDTVANGTVAPPAHALRRAGCWTLVTAFAVALTPITVFLVPWGAIEPRMAAGSDALWRDPVATMRFGWMGAIYAFQGVLYAVSLVAAALLLARRGSTLGRVQLGSAFASATLMLVSAGVQNTLYSPNFAGFGDELARLQPDEAIREMVGVSVLVLTQGIAGAAGLAVLTWMLAVAIDLRRSRIIGVALIAVLAVFGVLMLAVFHTGVAAGAAVMSLFPLAIAGVWLLVASVRRQGRGAAGQVELSQR